MSESEFPTLREHGFTIGAKIGSGGFASVYLVKWDKYEDRQFVAKIISMNSQENQNMFASYITEIQTLKQLRHPNIINIYQYFRDTNYLYIILEYCPHGNLSMKVKEHGPLCYEELVQVARQMLEALDSCHKRGIAHMDIKPDNILLSEFEKVKLSDFGLAESLCDIGRCYKKNGTIYYSPPELFSSHPYDPKKADIWSLGITLFVLATGSLPWPRFDEKNNFVKYLLTNDIDYPNELDESIRALIDKMLSRESCYRPTASDLLKTSIFSPNHKKRCQLIQLKKSNSLKRHYQTSVFKTINTHRLECCRADSALFKINTFVLSPKSSAFNQKIFS